MPEQVDLDAQRMRSLVPLYISIAGITTAVFIGDLLTPLGVAIWILYVVPLGMTLFDRNPMQPINVALVITVLMVITVFTDQPGMTAWVAYANRGFGAAVVWTVAVLARVLILTRLGLASEEWVRRVQTSLLERLQGEHNVSELGERALNILRGAVNAPAAAMYSAAGADFRLVASQGVEHGNALPATFRRGDGLVGLAAREKQVTVLKDLPEGYFALKSAFATGSPRHVAICPAVIDDDRYGIVELAFNNLPDAFALDLLERASTASPSRCVRRCIASACRHLLEETQRQAEELQAQQEELRVANEELEEQSSALKIRRRGWKSSRPSSRPDNAQLEEQTQELEQQQRGARRSTGTSRAREPVQVGVPRQHVARAAHAAQQRADPREAAGRQQGGNLTRGAGQVTPDDPLVGQRPADADQRHPRPREDRGGRASIAASRRRSSGARRRAAQTFEPIAPTKRLELSRSTSRRGTPARSRPTASGCSRS